MKIETPAHAPWSQEALDRLARLFLLRLYREASRTQRPLRQMMKYRDRLAAALDQDEESVESCKPEGLKALIETRLAELEAEVDGAAGPVADVVNRFGAGFGLDDAQCRILLLAVVAAGVAELDDALPCSCTAAGRNLEALVAVATGLDLVPVRAALAPSALLLSSGLIGRSDRGCKDLSERMELVDGLLDALRQARAGQAPELRLLPRAPAPDFGIESAPHLRDSLEAAAAVLRGAIAQRKPGVQILLYGPPGVGKSQLARLIGTLAGADAFLLPDACSDGAPLAADARLRRYAVMQRLLAHRGRGLLILDECEDMLATPEVSAWRRATPPRSALKAWKNRLLEESPIPGIWVGNWIHDVDPALLRRFTLALRVPMPPAAVKLSLLEAYGADYAGDAALRRLVAERPDIGPADLARAHGAAELAQDLPLERPARFLRALSLRAGNELAPIVLRRRVIPTLPYRLDWLNTDPPLGELVPLLREAGGARLCFWGPPGTGKTALAQHLAQVLGRPLLVKKASDLVSCWLGQTERNIAEAFDTARREDAFLLLDEADSFLRNRESAQRAFEVSEVNQLLKELEDCEGYVALCTNFFETLDTAVLRRLDLKLRFARLTRAQAQEAFVEASRLLGCDAQQALAVAAARPLQAEAFAPGDFAVALRQVRLRVRQPGAAALRDALEIEYRTRDARQGRPIGFAV